MYEHSHEPLLSRREFLVRQLRHAGIALCLVGGSLGLGMLGYHFIAGLAWVDAFLNAAMILAGMGPIDPLRTTAAKVFAGCYALFSGLLFLISAGVLFAPLLHRFLHHFHLVLDTREPHRRSPS